MTVYKLATAIFLTLCAEATAQTSFWTNSAVPVTKEEPDRQSTTVGLKFYSDVPGSDNGRPLFIKVRVTLVRTSELYGRAAALD